ncbi:NitT/TauT family transport system ATP-binding protein [Blastococcus haudaquaticus]|uniref:NitT/TauT family transport system ATP-binding protein n=1 Tax=Blastococcus haudaquaticus TaxID=1938745 RepID=A0A286H6C7_9ACTN|nr:NitT/TauT family transport system ATP-binding protein [Blastococcus haudaquaticus]
MDDRQLARPWSVTADGVSKVFDSGTVAVEDFDLRVRPGEFIALVGPSGCGKSTFLRMVAGLLPRDAGELRVHGDEVTSPRQDVGMMFQKPALLPWRTALENVLLPTEVGPNRRGTGEAQAREWLELVGLRGFEHSYPRQLSGGMQQRVALARLLLIGADVLLLDEPFGAVDELTRERLNLELLAVHERLEPTVLLVTHNLAEAVLLADRVIVMSPRPGRLAGVLDIPLERPRSLAMLGSIDYVQLLGRARATLDAAAAGQEVTA